MSYANFFGEIGNPLIVLMTNLTKIVFHTLLFKANCLGKLPF